MKENELIEEIDNLIIWINARRNKPLILSNYGADMVIKCLKEYKQYRGLGKAEELREAMEKQKAKKRIKGKIYKTVVYYQCPICGGLLTNNQKYCDDCGQAIDWS